MCSRHARPKFQADKLIQSVVIILFGENIDFCNFKNVMLFLTKFIGKFACDFATLIREKMVYFARVALSVFRMVPYLKIL